MMVVTGEPFCGFVAGDPVGAVVKLDHPGRTEHREGPVERGERNGAQRRGEIGGCERPGRLEEGLHDPAASAGETGAAPREAGCHLMVEIDHVRSIMRIVLIMYRRLPPLILAALLAALSASCVATQPTDGFEVVVTTSIWADVVEALDTLDEWTVEVLVPRGADPHEYAPSAAQVATLHGADLVVANGLGLEEGLEEALLAAEAEGVRVVWVAPGLDPLPLGDGDGGLDPHVWLDPLRVGTAATLIASEVDELLGGTAASDAARGFVDDMHALRTEMEGMLEGVYDRRLVTNHDALGYFADRFGFVVIGTVIPGGSTVAEPSSREVAALIRTIREAGISAIFVDAGLPHLVADAVADEFGGTVSVVQLTTGSLASEGEAATLVGLHRLNARLIAEALGGA